MKLLNFLAKAFLVVVLGGPVLLMVVLAILAPTAHSIIVALIALVVCLIAFLVFRGVSVSRRAKSGPTL